MAQSPAAPAAPPAKAEPPKTGQPTPKAKEKPANSATEPASRSDERWTKRHESFNERAKQGAEKGDIGVIFLGDSITEGWEGAGAEVWRAKYAPRNAVNMGIGGDRTQHVLWRLEHGNVDGLDKPKSGAAPRVVVLMIGTNNSNGKDNTAEEIADGIKAVVGELRERLPEAKVLLLGVFPRGEKPNPQREKNAQASALAAKIADGKSVHYLDIGSAFLEKDGSLSKAVMSDFLHLSPDGYKRWADAIEPKLKELLGEK
ncbi:MAG: GDSL family lipase [Phycisphaerales bacterium]|nr:GDSL family lipase [Phycisphaerales bacterium]